MSESLLDDMIEVNDIDLDSATCPPLTATFQAPWMLPPSRTGNLAQVPVNKEKEKGTLTLVQAEELLISLPEEAARLVCVGQIHILPDGRGRSMEGQFVNPPIVIGDIHGCFNELQDLLDMTGPGDGDSIIALGDIVGRGPETVQVLEYFRITLNGLSLMGNHERKHLRSYDGRIRPALSQLITRHHIS